MVAETTDTALKPLTKERLLCVILRRFASQSDTFALSLVSALCQRYQRPLHHKEGYYLDIP